MGYVQLLCLEPTMLKYKHNVAEENFEKRFFSSSYGGTVENFYIQSNLKKTDNYEINTDSYGVLCVVQNILQRGFATYPSRFLIENLGPQNLQATPLIKTSHHVWNNIKGDDNNQYYPARIFFYEILPQILGDEYGFVKDLMLPEAPLSDILGESNQNNKTSFYGQAVDFYLPQAGIVIEIDGSGHEDRIQQSKDLERDNALKKAGMKVFRIKTSDMQNNTESFAGITDAIIFCITGNPEIEKYRIAEKEIAVNDMRVKYDAVMRIQMALLNAFRGGLIPLNNEKLELYISESDIDEIEKLLTLAYDDLKKWIDVITGLAKITVDMPELVITNTEHVNTINLSIKMFDRYTDTDTERNAEQTIYIRTAYMPQKNHYRIATSVHINYKLHADTYKEDNERLIFLLKNIFKHDEFRDGQLPVIKSALTFEDTIGILPTGTGKSLCYQMAALLQPGISLVTPPIISLMEDQRKGMYNIGINRVVYINSTVIGAERQKLMDEFEAGKYQLMLISPERTQNETFMKLLQRTEKTFGIAYVVVDEVHCLSEWGHDFRLAYLQLIPVLKKCCNNACLIGLTATASQAVLDDIKAEFGNDGRGIKALASMDREELNFKRIQVKTPEERNKFINKIIDENSGTYTDYNGVEKKSVGIIFCSTVGGKKGKPCVEGIYDMLYHRENFKDKVIKYAGSSKMSNKERKDNQDKFMDKSFDGVMVCTKAFGMGIDKENIKYTIHSSVPQSIESFFQEAGRAGRDEDKTIKSNCYILPMLDKKDNKKVVDQIFDINTSIEDRRKLSGKISGDLNTILYFQNQSSISFDDLYEIMHDIMYNVFQKNDPLIPFEEDQDLKLKQRAVYRLTLLGVLKGWTIEYTGGVTKGNLNVESGTLDSNIVKEHLINYIHKHDREFSLDTNVSVYKKYREMLENDNKKPIKACARILHEWVNENILYSRLQSAYNMYELCSGEVSDEDFRIRVNEFFKYNEESMVFDAVVKDPFDISKWFNMLYQTRNDSENEVIDKENAVSQLMSLSRYLESYNNNTGLNYLSGMLRALSSNFENTEGERRLRSSLISIKESAPNKFNDVVKNTINIAKHIGRNEQNALSRTIIETSPECAEHILETIDDDYSKAYLIKKSAIKASSIFKEQLKWTI